MSGEGWQPFLPNRQQGKNGLSWLSTTQKALQRKAQEQGGAAAGAN